MKRTMNGHVSTSDGCVEISAQSALLRIQRGLRCNNLVLAVLSFALSANLLAQGGTWRFSSLPRVEAAMEREIGLLEVTLGHIHLWTKGSDPLESDGTEGTRAISGRYGFGVGLAVSPSVFLHLRSSFEEDIRLVQGGSLGLGTELSSPGDLGDLHIGVDVSRPVSRSLRVGISPYIAFPPSSSPQTEEGTEILPASSAAHKRGLYRHFSRLNYSIGTCFLATYEFRSGVQIHANLGLANCISRYHRVLDQISAGLGAEYPVGIFTPFAEITGTRFFENEGGSLSPLSSGHGPVLLTVGTKIGTNLGLSLGLGAGIPLLFRGSESDGLSYSTLPDFRPDFTLDAYLSLSLIRRSGKRPRTRKGTLDIQVKDENGSPIGDLCVELDDSLFHFIRTDESGRVVFEDLPAGTKRVFIRKNGYEPYQGFVRVKHRAVTSLDVTLLGLSGMVRARITRASTGEPVPFTAVLNGERYRAEEVFERRVESGRYRVQISIPGILEMTRRFRVEIGEEYELHIILFEEEGEEIVETVRDLPP
jgi:hypothetical protein